MTSKLLWTLGVTLSLLSSHSIAATYMVTTAADSGPGSLRQPILDSNASPPPNEILFSLPSPYTITPTSALPNITNAVNINAMTGWPTPTVHLDGSPAGVGVNGY